MCGQGTVHFSFAAATRAAACAASEIQRCAVIYREEGLILSAERGFSYPYCVVVDAVVVVVVLQFISSSNRVLKYYTNVDFFYFPRL